LAFDARFHEVIDGGRDILSPPPFPFSRRPAAAPIPGFVRQ